MIENMLALFVDNQLIAFLITMVGTIYWLVGKIRTELNDKKKEFMEKILITDKSVQSFKYEIKEKLTQNPSLYRTELKRVLNFLDKHLGGLKLFSFQAFDKHLIFSFLYSFSFFYLVCFFNDNVTIGIHQIILNENKLKISLYLIFEISIIYLSIISIPYIRKRNIPFFSKLNYLIVYTIILISIIILVGVKIVGLKLSLAILGMIIAVSISKKGALFLKEIVLIFGILGLIEIELHEYDRSIFYILFLLILPLINTIFDYLSMIASRYYAQKILNTHKKLTIFIDILLDTFIASLLLITLAFTLYHVIDFTNIYLIKDEALFIPIEHYKQLMFSRNILHPDVLWITLMFVSTLIPTFIHLYLFVYSLMGFVIAKPHLHQLVKDLEELDLDNHHKKEQVAYALADYRLTGWLRIHNFFVSALAIGCCVLLGVIIAKIDFATLFI